MSKKSEKKAGNPVRFKTKKRYRLDFVNENTFNRVWTVGMSRRRVIAVLIVAVGGIVCFGAMLISFTPLRTLLPGYLRNTERREYLEADARIDSLLNIVAINDLYLQNLNSILSGDISPDSLRELHSQPLPLDTALLLSPSPEEIDFVAQYSQHEGFSIENTQVIPEAPAFVTPVRDAVARAGKTNGTVEFTIPEKPQTVIYSIAKGRVADIYGSADEGWTLLVQHPDGYLSRYGGLGKVYVKKGQDLASGANIGQLPKENPDFSFELMRDGVILNPLDYIPF